MVIELQLWHLISLLLSFFGAVWGSAKMLAAQFEKRIGERFDAQEKRGELTNERIDDLSSRFDDLDNALRTLKGDSGGHLRHTDLDDLRREQKDDREKLYTRINTIDAKMNQVIGEFRTTRDTLQMLMNKITQKGLE
ncbi:MAG: hypothetical protein LBC37_01290 [Zoogloeaceae bacterium]|jgi:chaperonin cofactor prefoldin|nr:hypothetical protein [Zoogloeaceae bacterium]